MSYWYTEQKGAARLLKDLNEKPESPFKNFIIQNLKNGKYGDFTDDDGFGTITLANHLKQAGYSDLTNNVYNGAYDHKGPISDAGIDKMISGIITEMMNEKK